MKLRLRRMALVIVGVALGVFNLFFSHAPADSDLQRHRERLVGEIEAMGCRDPRVLKVINKVPRHHFIPDELARFAYINEPLPIGENQTISQPYVVAFMTEALMLKSTDKVLEVGAGSGYQAAVLSELVDSVFSIEIIEVLGKRAAGILDRYGYRNVHVRIGDGYQGWPEQASFDAIMVTAAAPAVPEPLVEQLKDDGRMILPIGNGRQQLVLVTKENKNIQQRNVLPVAFVPMTGRMRENK